MQNFIKAMDQNSAGYMHLKKKVSQDWVFVGPQITELIQEVKSGYKVSEVEKAA